MWTRTRSGHGVNTATPLPSHITQYISTARYRQHGTRGNGQHTTANTALHTSLRTANSSQQPSTLYETLCDDTL